MSTEISVRGSFTVSQPPQRATVHAAIAIDGPGMNDVYRKVAAAFETVKASITSLHDPEEGPVTWWSHDQLRTWSNRPWNNQGQQQLPLVHHAAVNVQTEFRDFAALSRWVGQHAATTEGFRVSRIEWALTTQRQDDVLDLVRTMAVKDSHTRAKQYARALGLGEIRPISIADAGMHAAGLGPVSAPQFAHTRAATAAGTDVQFTPTDIEVSATVDARFIAENA